MQQPEQGSGETQPSAATKVIQPDRPQQTKFLANRFRTAPLGGSATRRPMRLAVRPDRRSADHPCLPSPETAPDFAANQSITPA